MNDRSKLIKYHAKNGPGYIEAHKTQDLNNDDLNVPSPSRNHEKCAVRTCANTLSDEPCKIFFPFPSDQNLRAPWYRACGLDVNNPPKYALYCCEEHFDLKRETNVAALRQVAGTGGVTHNLLKDRVVPHRQVVDNPLWSTTWSRPSSGMSSPQSWHQPSTSPGGSSLESRPSVIQRNCTSDGGPGLPTSSGPKIRVKTASELNSPAAPEMKKGRPADCFKTKKIPQDSYKECVVPNCPTNARTFPDAKFVCCPFNPATRKIWYNAIGRPNDPHLRNEAVFFCTDHFEPSELECFKLPRDDQSSHVRTKHGAFPTLKLGKIESIENPAPGKIESIENPAPGKIEIIQNPAPGKIESIENPAPGKIEIIQNPAPSEIIRPAVVVTPVVPAPVIPVTSVQMTTEPVKTNMLEEGKAQKKRPVNSVVPTCKMYEPKSMPQYPECKPPCPPEFQCSSVTVVEYSRFYSHFYSLNSRVDQNEFIFSHTELNSDNPFPDTHYGTVFQPRFKFYVDVNCPPHPTPMARVCAFAFATSLSVDIEMVLGLLIQNVDRVLNGATPPIIPTLRLEPVKTEDGSTDDLMVYNPIPEAIEVSSDSEEDPLAKIKKEPGCDEHEVKTEVKTEPESPPRSRPGSSQRLATTLLAKQTSAQPNPVPSTAAVAPVARQVEGTPAGKAKSGKRPAERLDDSSPSTDPVTDVFESMHLCSRCLAQFKSLKKFEKHEKEQTCQKYSGTYFNCETCGRTYYKFEDLRVHTTVVHKYICPKCSDTFRYRRYLEDHVIKCSGTNKLSEKMRILIKNAESKTDAPPPKKPKTDMTQSSVNSKPPQTKNQESRPTPLLRPAVLKLDNAKIPCPTRAPLASTSKNAHTLSRPTLKSKYPLAKRKGLKSNTKLNKVPVSSSKTQPPLQDKSISSVTEAPLQLIVSESDGMNMQHLTQQSPCPDRVENQSRLPHETATIYASTNYGAQGLELPSIAQRCPATLTNNVQSSQLATPARLSSFSMPGAIRTALSGMNPSPITPSQHRTLPVLNDSLPDFYNLMPDSPVRVQKPLVRTSQPPPVIKPARLVLQQQVIHSEPWGSSSCGSSLRQDTASHNEVHDRTQDEFTGDIMSPLNRLVHANCNGLSVTIQNPRSLDHPSVNNQGFSITRHSIQPSILSCQSRVLHSSFQPVRLQHQPSCSTDTSHERYSGNGPTPPVLDLPQQQSRSSMDSFRGGYGAHVKTPSLQTSFDCASEASQPVPGKRCQPHNASPSNSQLFPNASHSSQPTPIPIPSLLDVTVQPPKSIVSQYLPAVKPAKNKSMYKKLKLKGFRNTGTLTPLSCLKSASGALIRNFSEEHVLRTEETIKISLVVLDQRTRSVGSQTTLPLVASDSSRKNYADPDNCKGILTPVCMLKIHEGGTPIKNYSDECIALFDKAVTISKEVLIEPNKRSVASQTTLPLVASETKRTMDHEFRQEPDILIAPRRLSCWKRTMTEPSLLRAHGIPIENFSEEYLMFAEETITIAHECFVAPNKRSVSSQTTLPLEASKMCRHFRPSRQQRKVLNFFKNVWNPNIPLISQPGWMLKQPKADAIPNARHWSEPSGFDFVDQRRKRKKRGTLADTENSQLHPSTSGQVDPNVSLPHHGDIPSDEAGHADSSSKRSKLSDEAGHSVLPNTDYSESYHLEASRNDDPKLSPRHHGDSATGILMQTDNCSQADRHLDGSSGHSSRPNSPEHPSSESQEIDLTGIDFCFS